MNAHIIFDTVELYSVESVKINSSWQNLTDTATVVLPRSLHFKSAISNYFKVGDAIEIELGYNGQYIREFKGYITKISADSPVTIECQDRMYELKKLPINKNWSKTNLKGVIDAIIPKSIITDVADIDLGGITASKTTVSKVLQDLKDKFKIYSYFKNDVLVVGKIYTDDMAEVNYEIEKNIISNDLKFRTEDDFNLKVTAVSYNPSGTQLKASVGDDEAPETEIIHYNITAVSELQKLAQLDYDHLHKKGYEGTITTFGIPFAQHGYKATINSTQYPERNGVYFIDEVNTEFQQGGFRRTVKIGKQAS